MKYLCLSVLCLLFTLNVTAEEYDVVVYSGVPAGIAASIKAADEGVKVLLIEPTGHVGGLSTSGINTAESEHMLKWTIGGFADDFYRKLGDFYKSGRPEYYFESSSAEKVYLQMLASSTVKVHYNANLTKVHKEGEVIKSIELSDGKKVSAKVFIDASYEGDLMAMAGVSYTFGRESKAQYGEEAAGIRFDKKPVNAKTVDENGNLLPGISAHKKDLKEGDAHHGTMNYNFRLTVTMDPEKRVPFPEPEKYERKRYSLLINWLKKNQNVGLKSIIDFYRRRNGKFEMNNKQSAIISLGHFGGQFNFPDASFKEREEIFADHLNYTLGLIYFLRTDKDVPEKIKSELNKYGLHKDEFADNNNLPYQLYVREARRMVGEYVVRQQDVQDERRKEDSIGISSHFIDSHHVQRVAISDSQFVNEGRIWRKGYAYQIPYRSLLPKKNECTNLLVPGAASFTHVAFCTLRLESVWMITGHAAGVAAAMAVKNEQLVHSVNITKLQDKLRSQKQVVDFLEGKPEKCEKLNGPPEF